MVTQEQLTEAIRSLDQTEAKILYLRCLGLTVEQTAELLNYSKESVNKRMAGIYTVFDLNKITAPKGRLEALRYAICPFYSTLLGGFTVTLDDPIWDKWPDIEIPRAITPAVIDNVGDDEAERKRTEIIPVIPTWLTSQKPGGPIPPPPPRPLPPNGDGGKTNGIKSLVTLIGCLVGLLLVCVVLSVAGFFAYRSGLVQELIAGVDAVVESTEPVTLLETPEVTEIINPQETVQTPLRNGVEAFTDEFEDGLDGAWEIQSGEPAVGNGTLGAKELLVLYLGNSSWTNYEVEFDIVEGPCDGYEWINVGVRVQPDGDMTQLRFSPCSGTWATVIDGTIENEPQTEFGRLGSPYTKTMRIIVEGNKFQVFGGTAYLDTAGRFESGGVMLRIQPRIVIDNFKVTPLP